MTKAKTQYILTLTMRNSEIKTAEIYWVLIVIQSNFSLNSCDDLNECFDSTIAQKYSVAHIKLSYVISFGLAKHFVSFGFVIKLQAKWFFNITIQSLFIRLLRPRTRNLNRL